MRFHRTIGKSITLLTFAVLAVLALPAYATPLAPFIDLQEKGLTLVDDGDGLVGWGGGPRTLTVDVQGPVRFALLYWAGRERPCAETAPGDCSGFVQPFKDQQMVFNGTPITGTVIGTETQPVSGGGPILNVGYFADVTSLVSAAGPGLHDFTFEDGNDASNLWRLNGVGLLVAYTNSSDPKTYRVLVWDGLDFAFGPDPTPGDTRMTAPVTFNHGANSADRMARLRLFMGDGTIDRPDHVTISNNPTQFNELNGDDGAQWETDDYSILIPSGVGTTTIQVFSAPSNQNPDSLLWEVAALRVEQLDAAAPTCPTQLVAGPPAQAITTFEDNGSGLASLLVTKSENADTVVPPFAVGTTDPVVVTATKIDQTKRARIEIIATDLAGNSRICDPIHTLVVRNVGNNNETADLKSSDVPFAENKVTIINGSSGLATLEVKVNGQKFKASGLKDGETRTLDISSAMQPGDNNVVGLKGTGKPGSWADVFIWDGVSQ
ncbi:MAG TPA: hypothetical protein VEL74_22420 [Thermoanaerobaculia bacterium]|nr:hypothetical protein [Thermoanaerobaculia bacterium]